MEIIDKLKYKAGKYRLHGYKRSLITSEPHTIQLFGSATGGYGSYALDVADLSEKSTVFSFGVGEDLSFESALLTAYPGITVFSFDPTPKSIRYVESHPLKGLEFMPIGISDRDEEETFYLPVNQAYVSGSAEHFQKKNGVIQNQPIQVPMLSLDSIMKQTQVSIIDVLKMDVEGSEFKVLEDIFRKGKYPKQICVEFHERYFDKPKEKMKSAVDLLTQNHYSCIYVSPSDEEFTFFRN